MLKNRSQSTYENGIKELTLEDITNNLKKPLYSDHLDLENVYDFLNTVSISKGKSGFVTIKKHESRKKSCETLKTEGLRNEFSAKAIREKSLVSSPTQVSSPKMLSRKQDIRLKSNEEMKVSSPKPIKSISRTLGKVLSESNLKPKSVKDLNSTRDRVLSPYVPVSQKSDSKFPILQKGKKRIRVIKLDKPRKSLKSKK